MDKIQLKTIIKDNLSEIDFVRLQELIRDYSLDITDIGEVQTAIEKIESEIKNIHIPEIIDHKDIPRRYENFVTMESGIKWDEINIYENNKTEQDVTKIKKGKNVLVCKKGILEKVKKLLEYYSINKSNPGLQNLLDRHQKERGETPGRKYTQAMKDYYISLLSNTDQTKAAEQTINYFYPNAIPKSISIEGFIKQVNKRN